MKLRVMLAYHYSYTQTVRAKVLRRAWKKKEIRESRASENDEGSEP